MDNLYDVIIVGARVAGSSLAYELSKVGYKVLLVDKTTFPSDTLSTHNFFGNSLAMLREMGVLDQLLRTATPTYRKIVIQFDDAIIDGEFPEVDGETECLCIRRSHLDQLLFEHAASQENVTTIEGFRITDVIRDGDTVTGIVGVHREGTKQQYNGKLIVGADGRNSTLRYLVDSRCKVAVPTDFASYVGYYANYNQDGEIHAELYKVEDKIGIVFPTSDQLYVVGIMFPLDDTHWAERFKRDSEAAMLELTGNSLSQTPMAARLHNASLVGQIRGLRGYNNDWYQGMGNGWALVGDAISFKDPAVGQGMQDALYGARILTSVLTEFDNWSESWEQMGDAYQYLMEKKMMPHFYMACQFTKNKPFTEEQKAINHMIAAIPEATNAFLGIYNRAVEPQEFEELMGKLAVAAQQSE